ncbi:ataxin-2 isoform X8 [Girardinichthys multiradiatus]|uniref:ataxin-2 isoform X8 n=1 Tax=Girardinichthys multiradiatus TaxID=208333 RepID=UPI001FAD2C31|nr:ataxin-2 isoform X8 [Girardinichthys multiradiatus]
MSMKAGGNRGKPGGGNAAGAAGSGAGGSGGGRQNLGRGRHSGKAPAAVIFNGVYANMRMVHVLTSVVGAKCELKVKNGAVYEGVFKTYSPECDLVLDAAHRKSPERSIGPRKEDIVESLIFKASDVVVVTFKDVDLNFARKDNFTDAAVSGRINGEHKEKDLEPWDGGDTHNSDSLESLDTDVSNGWDPNDMFKYNEEKYGVLSTYDSSLSTYTVPLERNDSEEFLKREARAAQLAEEIEASATYKARVALENDERSEEEKYTAVMRGERETQSLSRENKYIPPGQRNREAMSWGAGRQNSPRLGQSSAGASTSRPGPHDYSPNSDQRVVNGGSSHWPSPCPSPSSRPPSRYQSGPYYLHPRATSPTRPPSRPPSRPSRPPSHSSHLSYPSSSSSFSQHGPTSLVSTLPKRMSSEGPPRMSPKSQRTPRAHRVPLPRISSVSTGVDLGSHNPPGEVSATPPTRSSSSGGTWSSVVSGAHRPRSPRQSNMGRASPGSSSLSSPQMGTAPVETVTTLTSASSPAAASPAPNMIASPSGDAKECRVQETRQSSPSANNENIKPLDNSPSITRPVCKGPPSMAPDHRKQIDNLKKFSVDFVLQPSSSPDPAFDQMMTKPVREPSDKRKDLALDKASAVGRDDTEEGVAVLAAGNSGAVPASSAGSANTSKPGSPAAPSPSPLTPDQKRGGQDVTSQGVQTTATSTLSGPKHEEKEEKKEAVQDQVRKSTLNPNAHEFKPRFNTQPKPANTPTPPRPQGQPSPSIMVQQPPAVYGCFPQMYPLTPVSPGVQSPAVYQVQMPHMAVSQSKPYRPGKVPNMPQQRSDQHHPPGTPTMMHPATAAGPPIVAPNPVYSAQYFTCSPQQFTSQALVQQMPHYQSQAQHVFSPVMQSSARMIGPPTHGQPGLVSSSTTQYPEQTHTMYVSPGPMPQQYPHPNATLHPHPQHPQQSATPTGQAQQGGPPQHGGPPSHPAASPVQHPQHQQAAAVNVCFIAAAAAQALHLTNAPPQQQIYSALAPTPPSMTPNPQSPQTSFPSAQQTVYIHPQQMQPGYNPNHMAHMQQAHMQSGIVPSHHPAPTHATMMLMATQGPPGGPQPPMPQTALNPIPVSSTTHFSYLTHPQVQPHHHHHHQQL